MNTALSKQPKNHGTLHADNFQTPPRALAPLLPYLCQMSATAQLAGKEFRIWEPACGKGNLARSLEQWGFDVLGSDIEPQLGYWKSDFLQAIPHHFFAGQWDCIVTNPPFSIKDKFIARCYELGKPWALLLPLTTFEGIQRQKMFREHGVQVIFFPRRVHFETPSGKGGSSWFATMWVTHGLNLPKDLNFADPDQYSLFASGAHE